MLSHPEVHPPRTRTDERPRRAPRTAPAPPSDSAAVAALVRAAAADDDVAWRLLVMRFTPALRAAARGFRLAPAEIDDVVQSTWLAAFLHIRQLQKPEAFGAWVVVTARRNSLRSLQRSVREIATDEPPAPAASEIETPESLLLETERKDAVRAAVKRLPHRQRRLLTALLSAPDASYDHLARRLNMPVGSIGPTRERALAALARDRHLIAALRGGPAGGESKSAPSVPVPFADSSLPREEYMCS